MSAHIWSKVHNFGIYRKGGKRCILQLDFPGRALLVIHKGHIKKTHSLDSLQHYDSEEGLHVSLKFQDGEIDFEADNTEEKYTICRLLGHVLQLGQAEDEDSSSEDFQAEESEVIKEGILEKKGNTTITTWNRRRVRLCPGEFSYYKPGEELALNIVQLWPDDCELSKHGQNAFHVSVRDRVYSFRVPSEYKAAQMTQIVRDEWFMAFEQALNHEPPMAKMFEPPLPGGGDVMVRKSGDASTSHEDSEPIYSVTPDMTSARDKLQHPGNKHRQGELTAHVTVHLNYIDKGVPASQTAPFTRSQSSNSILAPYSQSTRDVSCSTFRPDKTIGEQPGLSSSSHSDLSNRSSLTDEQSADDEDPFAGSAAAFRAKLAVRGGKSSSLKAFKLRQDLKKTKGKGQTSSQKRSAARALDEATLQIRRGPQIQNLSSSEFADCVEKGKSPRESATNGDNSSAHRVVSPSLLTSAEAIKRMGERPPPPPTPPSGAPGAPPLPPLWPPPPPPLTKKQSSNNLHQSAKVKLKQVHWVKVNSNQIASSIWRTSQDMLDRLDLAELESQFSVQDVKPVVSKPRPQEGKQMLVDTKRAQNLGILFCGLKLDSLIKLTDALNSTSEVESFPADKMATLKRYQPTTDEVEMYRMYASKRDTLHDVDQFMLELCQIPHLRVRLDLVLTLWEFPAQHDSLEEEVDDLLCGCEEVLGNSGLPSLLAYLLSIGNYMNSQWNSRPSAQGFLLASLDKILSIKGRSPQSTLCKYLVKQLQLNDPSLLGWADDMQHVTKCADYSVKAVGAEIEVLKNDLQKIKKTLKAMRGTCGADDKKEKKFLSDVQTFIVEYDRKMDQMDAKYAKVKDKYKQLQVRFGEPPNRAGDTVFSYIHLFMEKFQQAHAQLK